ncbi:MAG TPA: hypothetical protein VGE12_17405 [Noviherbaspirillum sp.]
MPSAAFPEALCGRAWSECGHAPPLQPIRPGTESTALPGTLDDDAAVEWDEEDIVFLHWRLLKEVSDLADPETPLEEKFDTLRWIFTEREKESRPFSFVNCLKVVGCSPLSPTPYFGRVDAEEIRDAIRSQVKTWLHATLDRYPPWVRDAVLDHPEWVESRLAKNPQWINEQIRKQSVQGDLFASPAAPD